MCSSIETTACCRSQIRMRWAFRCTPAGQVSSSLSNVLQWVDQAVAAAQRIRAATDTASAAGAAAGLAALMQRINDEGLQDAQTRMGLMLTAEGLLGAPR